MTKTTRRLALEVLVTYLIPVLTVFLFSFTTNKNENAFRIQRPLSDTIPALSAKSSESGNLVPENHRDLTQQKDSSHAFETIEASYPGGSTAWMHYLIREFRYPQKAQLENIQGQVILHFTVDEKGRLSNIEALTGDPILQKEAKRVLRNGGKWIPAYVNGKPAISTKEQTIIFRLKSKDNVQ